MSRGRRALRAAIAVAISGAIVALLLAQIDAGRAVDLIAGADLGALVIAALLTAALIAVRGWRFHLVFADAPVVITSAAIGVQTLLNRIAPMRLGELSLPYLLKRATGAAMAPALVSLLLIRVVELAVIFALLAVAMLARGAVDDPAWFALLCGLFALMVAVLANFRLALRVGTRAGRWLARLTRLDRLAAVDRAVASLERAADDARHLPGGERLAVLALTLVALAGQIGVFYAVCASLGVDIGVLALVQASCVTFVGSALPLPTVGSIGALEASWAAGFIWVGIDTETAILSGFATQVITLMFTAVLALGCWWLLTRRGSAG